MEVSEQPQGQAQSLGTALGRSTLHTHSQRSEAASACLQRFSGSKSKARGRRSKESWMGKTQQSS